MLARTALRQLKLMSWTIDMSESTTFTAAIPPKAASAYFCEPQGTDWKKRQDEIAKRSDDIWNHPITTRTSVRPRRQPKASRLAAILRTIELEAPDVLCLQDCDEYSLEAIDQLVLKQKDSPQGWGYQMVNKAAIEWTGFIANFVKTSKSSIQEASGNAVAARQLPFASFSIRHGERDLLIANIDLTPVVRDLSLEGFAGNNDTVNRSFYASMRERDGSHAKRGADDLPDNFTQQREAALRLLARGSAQRFTLSPKVRKLAKHLRREALSGGTKKPTPDIIIGNSHLRHGWTMDRMASVLPNYADAWEFAGRPGSDWETYAFYDPKRGGSTAAQQPAPTNCRYFDDDLGSRAKGGRYEKCFLKNSIARSSKQVTVTVPRPMMEENCSCSDQFPLVVIIS